MIVFGDLQFELKDGRIALRRCGDFCNDAELGFLEIQLTGENRPSHMGTKLFASSEEASLRYLSHSLEDGRLEILQENERLRVKTVFEQTAGARAIGVVTEVENRTGEPIELEEISTLVVRGIGAKNAPTDRLLLTRFSQSHHVECQPVRATFPQLGLSRYPSQPPAQSKLAVGNVGSWSTKEYLPQALLTDTQTGHVMMFQIESNASWYYEISDCCGQYDLWLGGATRPFGDWCKPLAPGARYQTRRVALAFGDSEEAAICAMTAYRRKNCGLMQADYALPVIFNEYMYLSWDSPDEARVRRIAPLAKQAGAEYYVIDCGWHDEVDGGVIYSYVGEWRESHTRFPGGVRATTDYLRSIGLKPGLWIEPEVVGVKCERMLAYYDDDCFISRHGKRIATFGRYFLDYRHPKVRKTMTETIRRMVEDYGAEYIKFDYNQDMGVGTDRDSASAGEGLEACAKAFLEWVAEIRARFPSVILEGCASGGMRMDPLSLSAFSLASTSDQTDYLRYPYIAGNILSAVLPEQAAVWSYPVGGLEKQGVDDDRVVLNMVNSLLGRMHLASDLEALTARQMQLVQEGIAYYAKLSKIKRTALPYFPMGLTSIGAPLVAAGLQSGTRRYLAVWCLDGSGAVELSAGAPIVKARIAYPSGSDVALCTKQDRIRLDFHKAGRAVLLELECGSALN